MAETVSELLDRLLDHRYEETAKRVVKAIGETTDTPRVRAALAEFEAEAERLRRANLPLQPDNPILRNLTAEIDAAMRDAANLVNEAAAKLADDAIRAAEIAQTALPAAMGITPAVLVRWNVVSADALRQIVSFQTHPAWAARLAQYAGAPSATINRIALQGFAAGWNPLRAAKMISDATAAMPRSHANIHMRTLYLQSYKRAAAAAQAQNAGLITRVRRMASLDTRVCMVCLALHGETIPTGESVQMHEQCRCVSVSEIVGAELPFGPTGPEWFSGLDDHWQRYMMGPGAWEAWKAGDIALMDVVGTYTDDLYGVMLRQRGLAELVGQERAQQYHEQARRWRGEVFDQRRFPHP